MNKREFIRLLGSAAAWPLAARAQQRERVRRIGVLLPAVADDPVWQARVGAFLQALALLGWTIGRNIDTRWATNNPTEIRKHATELAALVPDVILAVTSTLGPLLEVTRTVPIVFTLGTDPVGAGFVDSVARPGRHRFHVVRVQHGRKMAGAAQADCAGRDARGDPSRCESSLCHEHVCYHSGGGAGAGGGGDPG